MTAANQPDSHDRDERPLLIAALTAIAMSSGGDGRTPSNVITRAEIDTWVNEYVRFADEYASAHTQELRRIVAETIHRMPPSQQALILHTQSPLNLGSYDTIENAYGSAERIGGFYSSVTNEVWVAVGREGRPIDYRDGGTHDHEFGHKFSYNISQWPAERRQGELRQFSADPEWRAALERERTWRIGRDIRSPIAYESLTHRGIMPHLASPHYGPSSYPEEAVAEMTGIYNRIYANRGGNLQQVEAFMRISYPELWPVFRDRFLPQLEQHAQQVRPNYQVELAPSEPRPILPDAHDNISQADALLERSGWGRNTVSEAYGPNARALRILPQDAFRSGYSNAQVIQRIDLPNESYLVIDDVSRLATPLAEYRRSVQAATQQLPQLQLSPIEENQFYLREHPERAPRHQQGIELERRAEQGLRAILDQQGIHYEIIEIAGERAPSGDYSLRDFLVFDSPQDFQQFQQLQQRARGGENILPEPSSLTDEPGSWTRNWLERTNIRIPEVNASPAAVQDIQPIVPPPPSPVELEVRQHLATFRQSVAEMAWGPSGQLVRDEGLSEHIVETLRQSGVRASVRLESRLAFITIEPGSVDSFNALRAEFNKPAIELPPPPAMAMAPEPARRFQPDDLWQAVDGGDATVYRDRRLQRLQQQAAPEPPAQRQEDQQQQQRNGGPRDAAPESEEIRRPARARQEEMQQQIRARREAQNPNLNRPHSEFDPVQPLPEPGSEHYTRAAAFTPGSPGLMAQQPPPADEPMTQQRRQRHQAAPNPRAEPAADISARQRLAQQEVLDTNRAARLRAAPFEHVMSPQEFAAQFSAERTMPPRGSIGSTQFAAEEPLHPSRVFAQGDPTWLRYEQAMRLYFPNSQIHTVFVDGGTQFYLSPEQLAQVQSIDTAPGRRITDELLADRLIMRPMDSDSGYIRVDDLSVGDRLAVINGLEERGIRTTGYLEIPSRPGIYFTINDGNSARVQILRSIGMSDIASWQEVRLSDAEARLGISQSALTEEVHAGFLNFQRAVAQLDWTLANRGFQVMTLPDNAARVVETLRQSRIHATMETTGSTTRIFVDERWTVTLNEMRAAFDQPPLSSTGVRRVAVSGYGGMVPEGITAEIPSTARLAEFSLHRLNPSAYGESEIIFNRSADIAELSRRIGLDIPADQIRALRVTAGNDRLGLNVTFNSFDVEQHVLENGGAQRLEAAARNLVRHGRSPNFSAPNPLAVTLPEAPRVGPSSLLSESPLARAPGGVPLSDITIGPVRNGSIGAIDITGNMGGRGGLPRGAHPSASAGPGVGIGFSILGAMARYGEGGSMGRAQLVGGEQLRTENIAATADFAVAAPDAALITTNTVLRQAAPTLAARVAPTLTRALGPVSILAAAGWTAAEMQAARAAQDGRREAGALFGFLGGMGGGLAAGAGGGAVAGPWGSLIGGIGGAIAGGYIASETGRNSTTGDQMQRNLDRSAQRVIDLAVIRLQQMDRRIDGGGELSATDRNDLRSIVPALIEQAHRLQVLPPFENDIDGQLRRGFQLRQIQQVVAYVQAPDARAAEPPLTSQQAGAQAAARLPAILQEINANPSWRMTLTSQLQLEADSNVLVGPQPGDDRPATLADVRRKISAYPGLELYMIDHDGNGLSAQELVNLIGETETATNGGLDTGETPLGAGFRNLVASELNSALDSDAELETALDSLHIPGLNGARLHQIMTEYAIPTTAIDPDGDGVPHEGHLLAAFDAAGVPPELLNGLVDDVMLTVPDLDPADRHWDVTEPTLAQLRNVVEPLRANDATGWNNAREISRIYLAEGGTRSHAAFQFTRFGLNRPRGETLMEAGFQRIFDTNGDGRIDKEEYNRVASRLRLRPTDLNNNSRYDPLEIYLSLPPEQRALVNVQQGAAWLQRENQRVQQMITPPAPPAPSAPPPEPAPAQMEGGEITRTNNRQSDLLQAIAPRIGRALAAAGLNFDMDGDGVTTRGEFLSHGRDLGEDLSRYNHSLPQNIIQRLKDRSDEQGRG